MDSDALTDWASASGLYRLGPYIGTSATQAATRVLKGEWLQLNYNTSTSLSSVSMAVKNNEFTQGIKRFVLLGGSDGGSVWSEIAEFAAIAWSSPALQTFSFAPSEAYASFRVVALENRGATVISIGEIATSANTLPLAGRAKLTLLHPDGRTFKYDAAAAAIRLNSGGAVTFDASNASDIYNAAKGRIALHASGTGNFFRTYGNPNIVLDAYNCPTVACYQPSWAFVLNAGSSASYTIYNDFNSGSGGSYLGYDPATDRVHIVGQASPLRINDWLVRPALDASLSRTSLVV